jgi:hypothetical protein
MDALRTRPLVLAGPLFAVLFVVGVALQGDTPGPDASGEAVVAHYLDEQTTSLTLVFLSPLLATLLVLFFAHLRAVARERRVSPGAGPTVMISGAVLWAAGILLATVLELALIDAADDGRVATAETLNVLSNATWLPFIAGIAITLIGAGMTVLGSDFLPHWLGWVALFCGIVSLAGPGGFLGFFVAPVWLLVAGLVTARPAVPLRDPHRVERRSDRLVERV